MPNRSDPTRFIPVLQYEGRGTHGGDPTQWIGLLLILAVLLGFGRLVSCKFTDWDDPETVGSVNPDMNPPTWRSTLSYWGKPAKGLYAPVTYTVWSALAAVSRSPIDGALRPSSFHLTSVLAHGLSVLVVYAILLLLFRLRWPACGGALLFALHPVQIEPVAWVSGFKDVLCGLLSLVAIWQYLHYAILAPVKVFPSGERLEPVSLKNRHNFWREPRYRPLALATLAFVAAMLAKPTAMVTPLICFALDYWLLRRQLARVLKPVIFWTVLALPVAVIAVVVQRHAGNLVHVDLLHRPLLAGDALMFYLGKLIAPIYLTFDYGHRPQMVLASRWTYFAWIIPLAVILWIIARRRKRPWLVAASLVFIAPLLPVLGFTPFLMQYISGVADHYLYLPMLGVAVALASILTRHQVRPVAVACGILFAVYIFLDFLAAGHWYDNQSLCQQAIDVNPHTFVAHINLGNELKRELPPSEEPDQLKRALIVARDHFAQAVQNNPDFPNAQQGLAIAEAELKNLDSMELHGKILMKLMAWRSLDEQKTYARNYAMFGCQFVYRNQPDKALPFLIQAFRLDPTVIDDLRHDKTIKPAGQEIITQAQRQADAQK